VRAAVETIEDPIAVFITRTSDRVDRRSPRRIGAVIEAVGDSIAVTVLGAPVRID
jgi:hypothetical protein